MELFKLETPITKKIEKTYNERKTEGKIPTNSVVEFLDFQPDESFINADLDGAIAVYGSEISFSESMGSKTDENETVNILTVDCYGFGAPIPKNQSEPDDRFPSVREAQNRAEVLLTIAYKAIADRREMQGSPSENAPKMFGSGVDVGVDKYPVSVEKFAPIGATEHRQGLCIYRLKFKFELLELKTNEALGLDYAGSDNIESETYNPGEEPE